MNLLVEKAPDFIVVGGKNTKINTSFSVWVEFFIACNADDEERTLRVMKKIFPEGIPTVPVDEVISACFQWLFPPQTNREKKGAQNTVNSNQAFDFDTDGSVIYCELWEYFPHLMERGITFHEGMELIKLLLNNDKTMLWHRAFARCGDFSKMDGDQKKYWMKQRAIWAIHSEQNRIDNVFSAAF